MTKLILSMAALSIAADAGAQEAGAEILDAAGIRGGVVVHVGCGDGRLTAALRANDSFLVHGLDADAGNVDLARRHIQSMGLYGKVAVAEWGGGRLPYVENFVNLIVAGEGCGVDEGEMMRVLAPKGVAMIGSRKIVKPWPAEIDEWTHYLHDPSNNAVAHDSVIDFPARMQWLAGPRYSRHHDHMSGASAMVSAGGRNFYIFEEAPRASILIPPEWYLYARDAFNGTLLWKRPIAQWHEHMYPLKSGPQILARRLVAAGDRVYATLGIDGPLSELDAATGATRRTFGGTAATEEILFSDGVLFLVVADAGALRSDPKKRFATLADIRADATGGLWGEAPRAVMAIAADSGKTLWKKPTSMMPMTLAADGRSVYFHDGANVVCLNRENGESLWASETPNQRTLKSSSAPTLVACGDVVLFSGYSGGAKAREVGSTTMYALSARDGKRLWDADHPAAGHAGSSKDILVINGVVWCGATASGSDSGISTGRDLHTGKVLKEFPPDVETHWFHQRCYRQKATEKYLLYSRTGIEFVDVANAHWTCHHWVRGACLYGIMPANGMIYNPPHPCACYLDAKLSGFNALAPASGAWRPRHDAPDEGRLLQNPQHAIPESGPEAADSDWPTYRGSAARSGFVKAAVPAAGLKRTWRAELGGKLSPPVIAGGRVFVAAVDRHEIVALDSGSGARLWGYTAGGRVDSPPTIWRGRVLFGCADGHVYCLRATDGALAWRFRAAPEDRRHFAFEQIESVWPVSGSVLVQDGALYCVAGRSMFLDGGLRMLRLDPATGKKLSETVMDENDPATKSNLQSHVRGLNMPVALADVLSSDGVSVYMRTQAFDLVGNRKMVGYTEVKEQQGEDRHLFSPTGFLDDTLWHRTYWEYGRAFASGAGGYYQAGRLTPSGRILVFDDQNVYGYGRRWQYYRWTTPMEFHLFATAKDPGQVRMALEPPKRLKKDGKAKGNMGGTPLTRFSHIWSDEVEVQATAMALADKTLFVAGLPDVVDEEDAVKKLDDPEMRRRLAEQGAAFEGGRGALLAAVSAQDGKELAAYRLDSAPVFDGLAAASGRLFMATLDGQVLCFGAGAGEPLCPADGPVAKTRGPDADKPDDAMPPATPSRGKKKAAPKVAAGATPGARAHPDFQTVSAVTITSSSLGYRLATDDGENGLALKRLPSPVAGAATFRLRIRPTAEGPLQTGFFAFGDGESPDQLIRCGVRARTKKCLIMQGAAKAGTTSEDFICDPAGPVRVEVTVDLLARKVKMVLPGKTVEVPMTAPLKQITSVGYYVMNGVTEFSPIEIVEE